MHSTVLMEGSLTTTAYLKRATCHTLVIGVSGFKVAQKTLNAVRFFCLKVFLASAIALLAKM